MGSSAVEIPCLNIEVAKDGYCLTRDQQLALVQEVTRDEINQAVQDIPNYKSPDIDGFPVDFFKAKVIVGVYAPTVITARLKKVVDKLVEESQTAFISGRSILDNVIVVHELVKGYFQKGLSPRCLIKIDIRKAYDSLEWNFLKMVLLEFFENGIVARRSSKTFHG
ncbi:hypothetical protein KY284_007639 [Solanum tuberosum]|nr:hypothetical protein KY284_007639 [Solanum tuberosum]